MPHLQLSYTFYNLENRSLNNDTIFRLRRKIALMFLNSDFGEIMDNGNKFVNLYAIPTDDNYYEPENELFICYNFNLPLQHGNLSSLLNTENIALFTWLRDNHHTVNVNIRVSYF